jgi:hypothetical protein
MAFRETAKQLPTQKGQPVPRCNWRTEASGFELLDERRNTVRKRTGKGLQVRIQAACESEADEHG